LLTDGDTVLTWSGPRISGLYSWTHGREVLTDETIMWRDNGARAVDLDNGKATILGGSSYSTRAEAYDPEERTFSLVSGARLDGARMGFGVAAVPAAWFEHLPGGCRP